MLFCSIIVLLTHIYLEIHSSPPIIFCNPVALLKSHHIILIYSVLFLSSVVPSLSTSLSNFSLFQSDCCPGYLDILNSVLFFSVFAILFQIFCKSYKFTLCSIIQDVK